VRARGLQAVDGARWRELLAALDAALAKGRRRELSQLAACADVAADEALRELAAFPARSCSAVEAGVGLARARCRARAGCPVSEECPLVARRGPEGLASSAPGRLVAALARKWRRDDQPAPPVSGLAELAERVPALLERSGRVPPGSPPRARTSIAVLDLALGRGGPFGATGPFLGAAEVEQVAAFVPPGSGRGAAGLAETEAWLRWAASAEVALVELP